MPMAALPYFGVVPAQKPETRDIVARPSIAAIRPRPDAGARTLLHHFINGTDLVDMTEDGVELRVILDRRTFEFLCMFDADDDGDCEADGDDEPDFDNEDTRSAPYDERWMRAHLRRNPHLRKEID